jgi:hypothetical protein
VCSGCAWRIGACSPQWHGCVWSISPVGMVFPFV